jgi:hypothetical protein
MPSQRIHVETEPGPTFSNAPNEEKPLDGSSLSSNSGDVNSLSQLFQGKKSLASYTASQGRDVGVPCWHDDPDNAMNWGMTKKIYNSSIPSFMCLAR